MSFTALFYIEQNYAYAILRPLQAEILAHGGSVYWLLAGKEVDPTFLQSDESSIPDVSAAIALNPAAVFVPGPRVPSFIPGLKVQVFHGLNQDKRGNTYPERGLFDLYCTEGPGRTAMLQPQAERCGYFQVRETGWLKLDSLFAYRAQSENITHTDRAIILFASTFTPNLSSAEVLYPQIKRLSEQGEWQWIVTLHPKMAAETVAKYRALEGPHLKYYENDQVIHALHSADIMVSDNSSVLQEFLLLKKPVVTFNNRSPQSCMLNISTPQELQSAIKQVLAGGAKLQQAIEEYGASVTPFLDGRSAARVYQATKNMLESDWQNKKPANYWRNWKMRCQLGYFKFF